MKPLKQSSLSSHLKYQIFGWLMFIAPAALFAAERIPAACSEYHERYGAFHHHRFESSGSGSPSTCYLTADPFDIPANFKYRSYLITNNGLLMVFNSYNSSSSASATGARVYMFFPRKQTPDIKASNGQTSLKLATPGLELIVSHDKAQLLGMKGARIREDPKVSTQNSGGVEILSSDFLYLDAGFARGQDPTGSPGRSSRFIDHRGKSCEVRNHEIFRHSGDGDADFKFSDAALKSFLSQRCPQLAVNF